MANYKPATKTLICNAYGISLKTLKRWIDRHNQKNTNSPFDIPQKGLLTPLQVEKLVNHFGEPPQIDLLR